MVLEAAGYLAVAINIGILNIQFRLLDSRRSVITEPTIAIAWLMLVGQAVERRIVEMASLIQARRVAIGPETAAQASGVANVNVSLRHKSCVSEINQ